MAFLFFVGNKKRYNASKAFVHAFTQGLRAECVGTGIRVSEILPGDVKQKIILRILYSLYIEEPIGGYRRK